MEAICAAADTFAGRAPSAKLERGPSISVHSFPDGGTDMKALGRF
jgi:hypothetical protein